MKQYQAPFAEYIGVMAEDIVTASKQFSAAGVGKLDDLSKISFGNFQF